MNLIASPHGAAEGLNHAAFPAPPGDAAHKDSRPGPAFTSLQAVLDAYGIAHSLAGRLRLRPLNRKGAPAYGAERDAEFFAALRSGLLQLFPGAEIRISPRTGSVLILYARTIVPLQVLARSGTRADGWNPSALRAAGKRRARNGNAPATVRNPIPGKLRSMVFYPRVITAAIAVFRSIPYLFSALRSLFRARLGLDALDGAALLVCLLQRDFRSLSSITFFFALGEYLADWTRKKSRASLVESLALRIDTVWIREGKLERLIPFAELEAGQHVVVRAGSALPADGTVVDGQGMVNQSSMTGESLPVHRSAGASVYAGTILEEGELVVAATRVGGDTRINSILRTIEESESVKASIQGRYERMTDAIVPYNFLLSGVIFALTRNLTRAGAVLLVDYSCAIRLATPLSIFTAMREAASRGVLIKGGKYMEAIAEADVVVFDKTGTLTSAKPELVGVIPFSSLSREEVLRLAACLEEHFVHPVGQAVVRASDAEGLKHREEHATVSYVVAHGIASTWREQRVLVGSSHFVLEDEGIRPTREQRRVIDEESDKGRSILYVSVGETLAGILLIEDEIRADAARVVRALRDDGVRRVIMLTGDGERTAASIAKSAGITEYRSRMLPEGKAAFIRALKQEGGRIAMVGDGINDSPALSEAHVGVAMAGGADMAREVADMVLVGGELEGLLTARACSRVALRRVRHSFFASLILNSLFLAGGLFGVIRPGLSALLHNATTAGMAVSSVRPLDLETEDAQSARSGQDAAGVRSEKDALSARSEKIAPRAKRSLS